MDPIYSAHAGYPGDHLKRERCSCSGSWIITGKETGLAGLLPIEHVSVRCTTCGDTRCFTFDTTAYTCKC